MQMIGELVESTACRVNPFTTYYNSFFILRPILTINGQRAEVGCSAKRELTISCRSPDVSITFDSFYDIVDASVKKYGLNGVGNSWCEDVPLFQLKFTNPDSLRRVVRSFEHIENEIALRVSNALGDQVMATDRQHTARQNIPVAVDVGVFLLTPDALKKDVKIAHVSLENITTCLTLWRESEVFTFGAAFRAYRMQPSERGHQQVSLKALVQDLKDVTDWAHLGVFLEVAPAELAVIRLGHASLLERKAEMLRVWLERARELPTWSQIVHALLAIGMRTLATDIAMKYGVAIPTSAAVQALHNLPEISQRNTPRQHDLAARIEQLRAEIASKDTELAGKRHTRDQLQKATTQVSSKFTNIQQQSMIIQSRVAMVAKQRLHLQKQLERNEQELQLLDQAHQKDPRSTGNVAERKRQEVQETRSRLHEESAELTSKREQINTLQKQVQDALNELTMKRGQLSVVERDVCILETLLDCKRRQVDACIMLLFAADSPKQYRHEQEHQVKTLTSEVEAHKNQISKYKSTKTQKEEMHKMLSQMQDSLIQRYLQYSRTNHTTQNSLSDFGRVSSSPGPSVDPENQQRLQKLTNELADLHMRLVEAEGEKEAAVSQLEAAHLRVSLLKSDIEELSGQHTPNSPAQIKHNDFLSQSYPQQSLSQPQDHEVLLSSSGIEQDGLRTQLTSVNNSSLNRKRVHSRDRVHRSMHNIKIHRREYPPLAPKPLTYHTSMKWRKCADLPVAMAHPSIVRIGSGVYVGGGWTTNRVGARKIYHYDLGRSNWTTFLLSPTIFFALTEFEGKLVLAGGLQYHSMVATPTNSVLCAILGGRGKKKAMPPFPTPRYFASAIGCGSLLIVCGGVTEQDKTAIVEVFRSETSQWYTAHPLPFPVCSLSFAITRESFCILGGLKPRGISKKAASTKMHSLVLTNQSPSVDWTIAPDSPLYGSTAVALRGQLLAVGGQVPRSSDACKHVYLYAPHEDSWVRMTNADIPIALYMATAVQLGEAEFMLIGGYEIGNHPSRHVAIATVEHHEVQRSDVL